MSKTDTCLRCGQVGHTSSSCKRVQIPQPAHTSEPFDGTEDMVLCIHCGRRGVFDAHRGTGCKTFIPSFARTPQRCSEFVRARA